MNTEENRAHRLSQKVFLKKELIPDYRGLWDKKVCFFLLFCPSPTMVLMILHECRRQWGPFESDTFSEKNLNTKLWGIKWCVQKMCFLTLFVLFFTKVKGFFLIYCMSVEDNRAHRLSQMFLKKSLNSRLQGLSAQQDIFLLFVFFSKTAPRIFLSFCMSVEINRAYRFSRIVFLKNS